jgi:carboxypeptidase C (cathepsin A)
MTYYESGHLMYVHLPSLAQQKQDLAAFINTGATDLKIRG